ncbi:unnamed protein product [Phyllotreta striolata]|uniref:Amino acid transporter transmembrane domain-containing protein n=1 Tax=Phyllotreta striolata TaxID=444603 RepID=A0A9N9TET1_PHYSR|nr:unnamed protein product [Phyllotreta striolata]
METFNGYVMNLANSIIGASVLAMPYCFKQCGIILSIVLLLLSSVASRLTCHFLLKSAIISRRKTFELLAFHLFGGPGKLIVEIGMIGFLLGTCITYFVVMGDLCPVILTEITKTRITGTMHTTILMSLALLIILPLGLLRNVRSLTGVSKATMVFYCFLILKVIVEALPRLFEDDWYKQVNLWRPQGILQCIPIFSMALFCQTQLFEIYEVVPNPTLDKMNGVIKSAVNVCTGVYICVGAFGYIAFSNKPFTGNVLLSFEPSLMTHVLKVGFVFSVAFSFPLVIFPCRASLYSLLFKEGYTIHEGNTNYIPEGKFKALTLLIVSVSLVIAILIPNIELVLGLVGSTIGIIICVLFPVTSFICISQKNTNERIVAQILLAIGVFVMVVGTYKNIQKVDNIEIKHLPEKFEVKSFPKVAPTAINQAIPVPLQPVKNENNHPPVEEKPIEEIRVKDVRHEPPQPVEPVEELKPPPIKNKIDRNQINDTVDIEAIKKEDKEEQLERKEDKEEQLAIKEPVKKEKPEKPPETRESPKEDLDKDHKQLIDTIQKQNEVQKEIVEQQKQLLEVFKQQQQKKEADKKIDEVKKEKMKAVKEIESIALKAIEKISEGEDSKKVVDDLKKGIEHKESKLAAKNNSKEFEKSAVNLQTEIQQLSSRLDRAGLEIKSKESNNKIDSIKSKNDSVLPPLPVILAKKVEPKENLTKSSKPEENENVAMKRDILSLVQ